jgi:hypothetical protein
MNDLRKLTKDWLKAKTDEKTANERRLLVEQQIAAVLPSQASEDTRHAEVDGHKVSVKYGVTRKVETEKLQANWDKLSPMAQAAFKWKADVTLPKLRALQDMLPDEYAGICAYIETKPSKPAVTVTSDLEVHA